MSDDKVLKRLGAIVGGCITTLFIGVIFLFTVVRVDVPADKVLVATRLSGEKLPEGQFVSMKDGQQGVLLKPYNEGLYWFNPYTYRTELFSATIIRPGEVGILIRLFGEDLPGAGFIAKPPYGEELGAQAIYKGVIRQPLRPGKYNINKRAYRVERYSAIKVPPGYVGVTVNLAADMAPTGEKSKSSSVYINSGDKYKGVGSTIRKPGVYYINPYCEQIFLFESRAQRFDFIHEKGQDFSIDFQSSDAFTLNLEGTIEWSISPERAPELLCRLSDLDSIPWGWEKTKKTRGKHGWKYVEGCVAADLKTLENKLLVPYTRSFVRMLGAKYKASEYISGQRRMEIQKDFQARLTEKCNGFGLIVRNVAISKIMPPSKVKEIINNRSLQQEQRNRILQNIEKLKSDAKLKQKQESIRKSQLMVDAKTASEKKRIRARQDRNVAIKKAEGELAVSKINAAKAETEKSRYIIEQKAKIDQEFKRELANIEALDLEVKAAGGGSNYIRSIFVRKLGTGMGDIVTNDDSFFMDVFRDVLKFRGPNTGIQHGPKDPKKSSK